MTLKEKATIFIDKVFGGEHHCEKVAHHNNFVEIITHEGNLSSFDFSQLTRIVVLAHDLCMRVELNPFRGRFKILLHNRERQGDVTKRHPQLEEQIAAIRSVAPKYKVIE